MYCEPVSSLTGVTSSSYEPHCISEPDYRPVELDSPLELHIKVHPLVSIHLDLHGHVPKYVLPHRLPRLGRMAEHRPTTIRRRPAQRAVHTQADMGAENERPRARIEETREGLSQRALRRLVKELEEVCNVDRRHVAREGRERAGLPEARGRGRGGRCVGGPGGNAGEESGVERVAREEGDREARGGVAEELVADIPVSCPRRTCRASQSAVVRAGEAGR